MKWRVIFIWWLSTVTTAHALHAMECRNDNYHDKPISLCIVDVRADDLRLFWLNSADKPYQTIGNLERQLRANGQNLLFATNSGIFSTDFVPMGLHIQDGRKMIALNKNDGGGNFFLKPNGVFAIRDGVPEIVDASGFDLLKGRVNLATQSGPLLLQSGKIHPSFHPDSENKLIRSGVGVKGQKIFFVISNAPINFYEFAELFRDFLGCSNALYLDGVISRFYAPSIERTDRDGTLVGMFGVVKNKN